MWDKDNNTSPKCILCHQEVDGIDHAISGCSQMSKVVTERHNGAGRIILNSIAKGQYGNAIHMMDVGRREKLQEAGIKPKSARIPKWIFPPNESKENIRKYTQKDDQTQ